MGASDKVAGGGLCEERPGAASCWTQPAPVASPQGSAETLSHAGGVSGKMYLKQGRKGWGERGGGNKRVKNNRGNIKVREEGKVLHGTAAALGGPVLEQMAIPQGNVAHGEGPCYSR